MKYVVGYRGDEVQRFFRRVVMQASGCERPVLLTNRPWDGWFESDGDEAVAKWLASVLWRDCTQDVWQQVRDLHHSGQDVEAWALIVAHTLSRSNDAAGETKENKT